VIVRRAKREKDSQLYMGKKRAYSVKPSITSGDRCRGSLPGLALLLSMGAASHRPHARSLRPNHKSHRAKSRANNYILLVHCIPLVYVFANFILLSLRCWHGIGPTAPGRSGAYSPHPPNAASMRLVACSPHGHYQHPCRGVGLA